MGVTQTINLTVNQGETFSYDVTYPGVDLTGFTGKGQIRERASADSPVVAEIVVTITTPETGVMNLSMPATVTSGLGAVGGSHLETTTYLYDVVVTDATNVYRVCNGSLKVSPSVTRL